ncbi:histamine H3 receptor-like [Haliotis rufescens]|uniref:histamine H3 receptor-like n=1 Tax=Haliotis rufescens TaxID=6454 RepID=UPI00201EC4D8|nr:histamine H3 receptor-like [Haliotis rufescens]
MATTQIFFKPDNLSLTTSTGATVDEVDEWYIPPWVPGVAGVGMSVLILLAVVGNLLVIISYFRDKQLQTVHNLYILNLAIADLFLGAISMIFYADFTLRSWNWVFGRVFCKIWCVNDYSMCLMSVLLILLLSLDRVILLRNGAEYIAKETKKVAMVKISIAWVIVFGIYGPCVVFWDIVKGHSVIENDNCDAEFIKDLHFTLITSIFEMTIPFIALSCLNLLVFVAIRKRLRVFPKEISLTGVRHDRTQHKEDQSKTKPGSKTYEVESKSEQPEIRPSSTLQKETQLCKTQHSGKDLKAARSLAVLVITFFICWAPYTIATVATSQCDGCLNRHVYEFFTWLLWAKSSINPFLYASQSKRFKENFIKLLPILKFCTKKDRE